MKTICLYFEIHQIIHLKRYRCFDIGRDHYYYDDYENERGISDIAERSYIPALSALIEMAKNHGDTFKVALSISGVALEQLEVHAPGVIELLHQLNETGCCEFLCEPYSHGLSSLANEDCFREEVERMRTKIKQIFGKEPKVFRNSSLIYSNDIGATIADMGFKGMLTEGAKHILGWKSPHYLYHCAMNPNLKLLLRDFKLSDDISLRFSNSEWNEYPLFADKYIDWIAALPEEEQVINIFMELSALGIAQPLSSNILEFMKALPVCAKERGVTFSTPTDIITKLKSVDQVDVPYPMSWIDEERDISPWLGNVMQREAFNKLYSVAERVHLCDDRRIKQDWDYLQASNNFRFMTTKNTGIWLNRGIYDSPYDAFTNYMNILGDFISRVNSLYPVDMDNEELNSLLTTIKNQGEELVALNKEVERLQAKLEKAEGKKAPAVKKEPAAKKATAKKPVAKKAASKKEEYRGAAPIQWAVINGEKVSGVTTMQMDEGLDTGDMILKTEIPIAEDETGESLHDKLAEAGAALCVKTLHAIENKTAVFEKQPESPTAYAKMLTKDLGNIDWAKSAVQIERLVRGLNSWPSAYTHRDGKVMKIWKALAKPQEECAEQTELGSEEHTAQKTGKNAMPGTVVSVAKDSFCIQTGDGVLRILEVQMPGKKRMDTGSFLRGYKVEEGMVFGRE